jgi:hypothetical protein
MRLPLAFNCFLFSFSLTGRTVDFGSADCGSNPQGKTGSLSLIGRAQHCGCCTCGFDARRLPQRRHDGIGRHTGLRNQRSNTYRFDPCCRYKISLRLTDKPIGYEPIINRSNRLERTFIHLFYRSPGNNRTNNKSL